jgi:hypothetical protein
MHRKSVAEFEYIRQIACTASLSISGPGHWSTKVMGAKENRERNDNDQRVQDRKGGKNEKREHDDNKCRPNG